jgi:hypothetical protein
VDAIAVALPKSTVPADDAGGEPYGWDSQHEIRALQLGGELVEAARVAGYLAQCATKSTESVGGVTLRIRSEGELRGLRCCDHVRRHIDSAWQLGARLDLDGKRLRRWRTSSATAATVFTKSRRYSTTFKALCEARAEHAAAHQPNAAGAPATSDHNWVR